MPIYEYQCSECQHQFDVMQKMNDPTIKICPECAKETVVRLVSAAGFQLKGTGWYATDFKDKGKPKPSTMESSSSTETKANSDSKPTETKGGNN
ncbi:MAG: FmdB family transcriptional regulator [Legionella sp.]|nr:MAG: FmdB family transcriptional regulator [Legionella sp.]